MTAPTFTQYSTIEPWLSIAPGWVPEADKLRISAYQKYEEIYWSSEEGFTDVLRGDNENPILMPTARTIVNTVNRYTAPEFGYMIEPREGGGTDQALLVARIAFESLFTREEFFSKFAASKCKGLRMGDWPVWHILADDTKPLGRRITIQTVDPASYFPVYETDRDPSGDPDKLVAVHLVETLQVNNQERVSRLTYERLFDANGVQTGIQVSHGIFKPDAWTAATAAPESVIIAPKLLPESIPAIPVYHLKNLDPTDPFGSSELRGLESVLLGINQTISDEDAALALDGIGVYATDNGAPRDQNGNEVDWILGPGRVLIHAAGLKRISGATSVAPFGDHYARLLDAVRDAVGASDVAMGKTDTATAESGIALLMRLGPILAHTKDKDRHIIDVHAHLFHDLCFWLAEYEELPMLLTTGEGGETVPSVLITPTIGDKIPTNLKSVITDVVQLRAMTPPLISMETSIRLLREAGMDLADNELDLIVKENEEILANFNGEQDDADGDARRQEEGSEEGEGVPA